MDWNSYGSRMNTSYDTLTLDPWQSTKFGRPMYWRKSSTNQVTLDTEIQFYQLLNYKIYTNCFSPLPPSYKSYILLISTLWWIWIHRKSAPKPEVNKIDSNRIVNTTVTLLMFLSVNIEEMHYLFIPNVISNVFAYCSKIIHSIWLIHYGPLGGDACIPPLGGSEVHVYPFWWRLVASTPVLSPIPLHCFTFFHYFLICFMCCL